MVSMLLAVIVSLSGVWVPDAKQYVSSKHLKQSDPNAPPAPPAASGAPYLPKVRIEHAEPQLSLEYVGDDGDIISRLAFTTDGKENRNERAGGALIQKSTTTWDGSALKTTWRLERNGETVIRGTDVWTLSDDGTTLTLQSSTEDSKSVSESTTVYRRR